jgi:uncharacterized protein (TIGR02598 family)
MRLRHRAGRAFSLVEIVMALGIASFVLLSLLGLSSLTLNQTQQSKRDILWMNMAQGVSTELRTAKWDDLAGMTTFYFDADGKRQTNAPGAFYKVEAKRTSMRPPGMPSDVEMESVNLILSWPADAVNPQQTNQPIILVRHE